MNNRLRNKVLTFIGEVTYFSQEDVRYAIGKNRYSDSVDNTVGRFVRRLAENGYARRNRNGLYRVTARGRKMLSTLA